MSVWFGDVELGIGILVVVFEKWIVCINGVIVSVMVFGDWVLLIWLILV